MDERTCKICGGPIEVKAPACILIRHTPFGPQGQGWVHTTCLEMTEMGLEGEAVRYGLEARNRFANNRGGWA